ncbi:MAG: hypothetical protein PHQ12_04680 [Chthoniobacteraceae bacterium]|nr:hypothetical protein [Chthoniobacteraceae bacterium]
MRALSVYELAICASAAIRACRAPRPVRQVQVVELADCPICHKTHRMGLGRPRCTDPAPVVPVSRGNPAYEPVFGRALAIILPALCIAIFSL